MSIQFCYNILSTGDEEIDIAKIKIFIQKLYKKVSLEGFTKDEKLPFLIIYSKKDNQVYIKLTSRAKKNVEKIENIHSLIKAKDLNLGNGIKLSKPFRDELVQCQWWDAPCDLNETAKWFSLSHQGPYFTHLMEPYLPHKAALIYDKKKYVLEPQEEKIANFYARRIISEQGGTITIFLTRDPVFNKNFFTDFRTYLTPEHKKIFLDFNKLDFKLIVKKLLELKEKEKNISEKEKESKKIKTAEKKALYGFAMINDIKEQVGNYTVEPAAIFFGRGKNINRGKIKREIFPEEVTINIGSEAEIPEPPEGHTWGKVIHDNTLAWIASWKEPLNNDIKYIYFSSDGQLKGKSDLFKYEKSRKLNTFIQIVRTKYEKDLKSQNKKLQQLGTALYLIDQYGLRVGNEKDETEVDTVGATTLRVEHITLEPPDCIVFDFLGKDSIQYYKKLKVPLVYTNIAKFIKNKKDQEPLFDLINAADINDYLHTFDKDFSAKAFRTRLASSLMDSALKGLKIKKTLGPDEKKKMFDKANVQVAEVLNHRRTVPPKAQDTIKKYQTELKELKKELKDAAENKKEKIKVRIQKKKDQIESKQDTLNIAITTSRTNYIDPRIGVAWSKKYDLNLNKIYSNVLQRKFKWAIDMTNAKWDYETTPILKAMEVLTPLEKSKPIKPAPARTRKVVSKSTVKAKKVKSTVKTAPKAVKSTIKVIKKSIPKVDSKVALKVKTDTIRLVKYTDLSFMVLGNTKSFYQELKNVGKGSWKKLTLPGTGGGPGEQVLGWLFSMEKLEQVEKIVGCQLV